jgi:hypothetical protein
MASAIERRGVVWIGPAGPVPDGRLVDSSTTLFWVSWQHDDEGVLADLDVVGADAAIAWARERADSVYVRLGSSEQTYFSAGGHRSAEMLPWPPETPAQGWWTAPREG